MAAEVLDLLKRVVGAPTFSAAYAAMTQRMNEKRLQRKKQKLCCDR